MLPAQMAEGAEWSASAASRAELQRVAGGCNQQSATSGRLAGGCYQQSGTGVYVLSAESDRVTAGRRVLTTSRMAEWPASLPAE